MYIRFPCTFIIHKTHSKFASYEFKLCFKRNVFLGKIFLIQLLKSLQRDTIQLSHISFTTSVPQVWQLLVQFSAVESFMLSVHVLSSETPFISWQSENDQDSDSDIVLTYCIDIWLLTLLCSLQYLSESWFGNNDKFLLPNFSFTHRLLTLNFVYPTLFSSVQPPPLSRNN